MTNNKTQKPKRLAKRERNIFSYIILSLASLTAIFPIYWMVVSSTNTSGDYLKGRFWFGTNFITNYTNLLNQGELDIWTAMGNSFKYAILQAALSLLICSIAGYGFEVYHSKGKDVVMRIILLAMMVPFAAIMIPLYQMFAKAELINTVWGFILPSISTPFLIMLFRQSSRTFPMEIVESARMDGLSELGIFFRMYVPVMKSTYAAAATIVFMNAWNNFMWPKIILTGAEKRTMPLLIAAIQSGYAIDYGVLMMAVFLTTVPTVLIFAILQKSFANGITGSIK